MGDQTKAIDFKAIIQQMVKAEKDKATEDNIVIVGGVFDLSASKESIFADETLDPEIEQSVSDKLRKFVETWQPENCGMTRAILETVGSIDMDYTSKVLTTETAYNELMRARFFGEGGDLSLRRDCDWLYWHFIGERKTKTPNLKNRCSYWGEQKKLPEKERVTALRRQKGVDSLLWGERIVPKNGGVFWREDRVGAKDLFYPVDNLENKTAQKQRMKIIYDVYWHNGQPAFVWLKDLIEVLPKSENSEDNNHA